MAILDAKLPAWQATTKNVSATKAEAKTLEGKAPLVIDGGGLGSSVRVLLKNQTKAEQNGLWEVTTNEAVGGTGTVGGAGKVGEGGTWVLTRTSDADSSGEVTEGMLVQIEDGETNQRTSWIQRTAGPIEVGVTAQSFEALFAVPGGQIPAGDLTNTYVKPLVKEAVIDNANVEPEAGIEASKLNLKAAVASTDLATSAKQLSPQLVTPAERKVVFGETTATFAKKLVSNTVEVSHGLGAKPTSVKLTIESELDEGIFSPRVWARTPTSFKFAYRCDSERNGSFTVLWEAIG